MSSTTIISPNGITRSSEDNLAVMPWKLLHDGYQVTRQETVVSVDPDSGIPVTHSRFTVGGRIISAKIFVDTEQQWWFWYNSATKSRALPCWVYDANIDAFMRCYILEQPELSRAGSSVKGCYVQLKLYAKSRSIPVLSFVTENTPENYVTEGNNNYITENSEGIY